MDDVGSIPTAGATTRQVRQSQKANYMVKVYWNSELGPEWEDWIRAVSGLATGTYPVEVANALEYIRGTWGGTTISKTAAFAVFIMSKLDPVYRMRYALKNLQADVAAFKSDYTRIHGLDLNTN